MKSNRDYRRMRVNWNQTDGFKLDIPYDRWMMFCLGLSLILLSSSGFIQAIRWW